MNLVTQSLKKDLHLDMSKWELHLGMLGRGRLEDIHATFSILKMYFYSSLLLYTFYRSDYNSLDVNNFYFFTEHILEWSCSCPLEDLLEFFGGALALFKYKKD